MKHKSKEVRLVAWSEVMGLTRGNYGMSIYRGVIVKWDEDHDTRVLDLLDATPISVLEQMLAVGEHEGSITFLWKSKPPKGYRLWESVVEPAGDCWCICEPSSI